jgi:apolipoprotein D and lipocalin family protein
MTATLTMLRCLGGMLRGWRWLAVASVLGGCALFQPSGNAHVPAPAKTVDLQRYLGHWYEFARYDSSFEHDCEAATADYTLRADGLIGVVNACHRGRAGGALEVAHARARIEPNAGDARLKLSFFGPFFIGTYWVLDHGTDYDWSIVGEPTGGYLWVLTRAAHPGGAERAMLVKRVAALGYDTGRLHFTRQ